MVRSPLWRRVVASFVVAVAIAAGCGGGGGGGGGQNGLLLYFGINGKGNCSSVVVNVDLAAAGAVLSRTQDGKPECAIDVNLAGKGCVATFTEPDAGDRLRAVIAGCTIPAVTNLFACAFDDVDVSDIASEASAQCSCTTINCDPTPPMCIDVDADPTSCEDCHNKQDDDGNGKTDCEDPTCQYSPDCNSTNTTIDGTTSTTVPVEPILIEFTLTSAKSPVSRLDFTANYTSAPGHFVGNGTAVSCTNKVAGASFTRDNRNKVRKLDLSWNSGTGFSKGKLLASCLFIPDTPVPVPANFTIVVNEATDTGDSPQKVFIGVTVNTAP